MCFFDAFFSGATFGERWIFLIFLLPLGIAIWTVLVLGIVALLNDLLKGFRNGKA
jgi:hypothetical protein